MRLPIKSETDAFYLAFGSAILIGLSVALGAIVTPLAGVALLAGGVLGALFVDIRLKDPERIEALREASNESPFSGPPARKRVLVVANQKVGGDELKAEILKRSVPPPELRVIVPVLLSRTHYVTSDIDREIVEAQARLDATLRW